MRFQVVKCGSDSNLYAHTPACTQLLSKENADKESDDNEDQNRHYEMIHFCYSGCIPHRSSKSDPAYSAQKNIRNLSLKIATMLVEHPLWKSFPKNKNYAAEIIQSTINIHHATDDHNQWILSHKMLLVQNLKEI